MESTTDRTAVIDDLRNRIARVPRLQIGEFPTPLTECPRLSRHLGGPRIFIKREDLSGLALGGNKTRLLEFRLAEALALGCDTIVAGLEVQSNSARQLTAAANRFGLRTLLVLRPEGEPVWQGNLLLDQILGAEITFLPSPDVDMDQALNEAAAAEQRRGHTPYVMNHARLFGIGAALAGLEWTLEAIDQLGRSGFAPTHYYLSSGGKCQAGMVLAQKSLGRPFEVVGVNARPGPGGEEATSRIANATAELLELEIRIAPEEVVNRSEFGGEGFGIPTPEAVTAIEQVARLEGILLDPVFTGKAMAGLFADVKNATLGPDNTVVFVHTGGIPALFSHAAAFLPRRP